MNMEYLTFRAFLRYFSDMIYHVFLINKKPCDITILPLFKYRYFVFVLFINNDVHTSVDFLFRSEDT